MRLNTGRTPSRWRRSRTSASLVAPAIASTTSCSSPARAMLALPAIATDRTASLASRLSEKPIAFRRRRPAASRGRPLATTVASSAMISAIWRRNHGSYLVTAWTSSTLKPSRNACPITRRRSGVANDSAALIWSRLAPSRSSTRLKPSSPVSRPRSAFCTDSLKLRPIAMTSPTDFIAVDNSGSDPLNFSKANRGILVTT